MTHHQPSTDAAPVQLEDFRTAQYVDALDAAIADAAVCSDDPGAGPPPSYVPPHPDSPVGRTARRLAADREAGVLPGAEPGQGVEVLRFLTDHELGAWTEAILAEHHRRRCQFADYREGARRQAAGS